VAPIPVALSFLSLSSSGTRLRKTQQSSLAYSTFSLYNLGKDLAGQVNGTTYTDCHALSDYASAAAYNSSTAHFVMSFMNLVPNTPGIPSVGHEVILYNGGDNGFASQFQNTVDDGPNGNCDQSHHFAAFLEFGYQFGAAAGVTEANVLEIWQSFKNGGPINQGDILLGEMAAQLGAALRSGTATISYALKQIQGPCK
jgi:hypothetical protein